MNYNREEKVISTFLKSLGPWKAYIVIGGGYAPIIYTLYFFEHKIGNPPVGTRDIDSSTKYCGLFKKSWFFNKNLKILKFQQRNLLLRLLKEKK